MTRLIVTLGLLFITGASFWLYSIGRTMVETVHVTIRGCAAGLLLVFLFTGALMLLASIIGLCLHLDVRRRSGSLLIAALCASLIGSLLSEAWIRCDEARFDREAQLAAGRVYSRDRAWPNRECMLVYIKGEGVHATD